MDDICGDNRFEIIKAYKDRLIEATNIEMFPDEMAVLDSILFSFWQMGWIYEGGEKKRRDVAPVVHAHWLEEEDCSVVTDIPWSMCSACGEYSLKLPYCAFCGAKMDEVEE